MITQDKLRSTMHHSMDDMIAGSDTYRINFVDMVCDRLWPAITAESEELLVALQDTIEEQEQLMMVRIKDVFSFRRMVDMVYQISVSGK